MGVLKDIEQNNRKKKFKLFLLIFLIGIGILGYVYFYQKKSQVDVFKSATANNRTIYSTLTSDGKVYYKEQYDLNFQTTGTLAKLYKSEGDEVKTGEIIAKLDDKYLQINLDKANIALKTANANLNAKLATKGQKTDINISEEQLKSTQTSLETNIKEGQINVKNAQDNADFLLISLNNTKESNLKDIENAQKNIESKQKDLENAQINLQTIISTENLNIKNTIEKSQIEINSSIPLFETYLRDIDLIIGVSNQNKNLNDSFEIYLGAKNSQTKIQAEDYYNKSYLALNKYKSEWSLYNEGNDIKQYLENILLLINNINDALENTLEMLKNSISSSDFSQSTIDSYILNIQTDINALNFEKQKLIGVNQNIDSSKLLLETKTINQNNSISSLELQIEQSKTALDKVKLQSKTTIDDLEQKYSQALTTLSGAKIKLQNNIDLSNAQIDISKANLNNKISSFDNRELQPYYTAIQNAKVGVEEARKRLSDTSLLSPINGKIAKLNISKVGTIISSNSINPFVIIINKDSLYIEAKIEEGDIGNIYLGQNVNLTFNSINDLELTGKVSYISDKAETDINGIVTYKVEVLFDKVNPKVKEGFTTQIYFILSKAENVLCLPTEVIKTENGISSVILKNKTTRTVKLGISDGDFVQILDGLKVGDEVIY
ncbi:MAG: HlyD family efflux transporter periplasmic adaptor subunit [Candidatus Gracilibacteria bacterium]|nr:HlyD family efflux transporter periplasmic adaptor subunit [Candidatus Gracilibacteria bacterium]